MAETLERDFAGAASYPAEIAVTFPGTADPAEQQAGLATYVQELRVLDGVQDAVVTGADQDVARIGVSYGGNSLSSASRAIVEDLRQVPAPPGATALVGASAVFPVRNP